MMSDKEKESIGTISLSLNGIDLDPIQVTKILLLNPTKSFMKGDTHTTSYGSNTVRKLGYWRYTLPRAPDISKQISKLVELLESHYFDLGKLDNIDNAYIDVFSAKNIIEGNVTFNFNLNAGLVQRIANLGLTLNFELCGVSEE
ncbi:DUF4279 domain-containing protein [Acinetobacter guillouiae]|uniref:DUF4279 domain-containing protein n=1 Tax=Acinetobacter TaxID=469 RepID=UPI001FBA0264|nr:DUF4279 domain-containing protein [Acinetobacter sp. NyZ410]UOH18265.1 DUF4279 domain-containing protein [Acinetobacter sp. NyZ410]